jgi:uncharacterized protein DUF2188
VGYDQKGPPVFRVARGTSGQWEVREEGRDKPLAAFNTRQDAREYARDGAKGKGDSADKGLDQRGVQVPAASSADTRNPFKPL